MVDAVQLYSDGQTARAQAILKTLSVAAPENDGVWYYLAQVQFKLNDTEAAREALLRGTKEDRIIQRSAAATPTMFIVIYPAIEGFATVIRTQPESMVP